MCVDHDGGARPPLLPLELVRPGSDTVELRAVVGLNRRAPVVDATVRARIGETGPEVDCLVHRRPVDEAVILARDPVWEAGRERDDHGHPGQRRNDNAGLKGRRRRRAAELPPFEPEERNTERNRCQRAADDDRDKMLALRDRGRRRRVRRREVVGVVGGDKYDGRGRKHGDQHRQHSPGIRARQIDDRPDRHRKDRSTRKGEVQGGGEDGDRAAGQCLNRALLGSARRQPEKQEDPDAAQQAQRVPVGQREAKPIAGDIWRGGPCVWEEPRDQRGRADEEDRGGESPDHPANPRRAARDEAEQQEDEDVEEVAVELDERAVARM